MAVDFFMKLDRLQGESKDAKHRDELEVLSWSFKMNQAASFIRGGGGGTGKVQIGDLQFTHWVDRATPYLIQECCNGKHFDKAILTCRKAGGHPIEFFKIEMHHVIISSIQWDDEHRNDQMTEKVTLSFSKLLCSYTEQNPDGSAGPTARVSWDIAKNSEM